MHVERVFVELKSKGCNSMLKLRNLAVTALVGRLSLSSGIFSHQRRYIRSVESLNFLVQ